MYVTVFITLYFSPFLSKLILSMAYLSSEGTMSLCIMAHYTRDFPFCTEQNVHLSLDSLYHGIILDPLLPTSLPSNISEIKIIL